MKTCTRCKVEKPLDAFSPDKRRSDGVRSWCKPCVSAHAVQRRVNDPEALDKSRRHSKAVQYAKSRLMDSHRDEYVTYLREEQIRLGIAVQDAASHA